MFRPFLRRRLNTGHTRRALLAVAVMNLFALCGTALRADEPANEGALDIVRRYACAEAHQGVAVDERYLYAIANRSIGKYDKQTGERVATWQDDEDGPLKHMNAGIVHDGKLYCAHSTYPHEPRLSSVEIWDADTLEHIGNHSFGEYGGALNWVDWHDGHWWAVFAYYSR